MADFQRYIANFLHKGIDLSHPSDMLPQGKAPLATNIRSYAEGTVQQRGGQLVFNSSAIADLSLHSGRQLNNPLPSAGQTYANFIGAGTALYSDNGAHNALTQRTTGYSGNPLFMMPARPVDSPEPFMYVGDSVKLTKSSVDGTTRNWGVAPAIVPPTIALTTPLFKTIDDFGASTFGDWSAAGPGTPVLTNPDRLAAVAITQLLYDTGTTGWALVNPASFTDIREGMFVTMSVNAETVPIDSIYKAVTTTTIGSIKYDSGTSGACTIQLATPTAELERNSMLRIAAAENVRVLSVTYGPDGTPSFRCVTTGTRSAGDAVAGLDAFRVYFANTHTTADTISTKMIQLVTDNAGASGITTVTRTAAFDLSTTNSRPLVDTDYVCIQIWLSDPTLIDNDVQIMFDVDGSTNDFTRNFYYYSIRASDLQPSASQTLADLTVQQRVAQREQLDQTTIQSNIANAALQHKLAQLNSDYPDPSAAITYGAPTDFGEAINISGIEVPTTQTVPGEQQWTVLYIPRVKFQRVGSDEARTWKNVAALRVSISSTDIVTMKVDAWWIGGTYGPNTLSNADQARSPYFYVYRYRASATGAKSAPSPPNRSGIDVLRGSLTLTPTASSDAQVDKIDWFRFGGTVNSYRYIGTQPNSGTFVDHLSDDSLDLTPIGLLPADADGISLDLQPFPVLDIPRTGTCDVVGTEVTWKSGHTFNTQWIRNAQIIIDSDAYSLYASPTSSTRLSLNENGGTLTDVTFYLPSPIIAAQPLDAYFGPWGEGEFGVTIFGVKDGTLYWTNGNDPDSCARMNRLEVTSSSEPLMNGCIYDGRPFLFSTERGWEIQPNANSGFITVIQGYMKGLYARWGVTVGDVIYYIYKDGLYSWPGDGGIGGFEPSLTGADLRPFFPHDGQIGVAVSGYFPPDFTVPASLRLHYSDSELYFDYRNRADELNTMMFKGRSAQSVDVYGKPVNFHYSSEGQVKNAVYTGSTNGRLYSLFTGATDDGGTTFTASIRTPAVNDNQPRTEKLLGDAFIEFTANVGEVVTVVPATANFTNALTTQTFTATGVREQQVVALPQEPQTLARNLGLTISWPSTANAQLFDWEFSYAARPENTITRATDWIDGGYAGPKYMQGVRLRADTFGDDRTVLVKYTDVNGDEQTGATLTVNHDGQSTRDYSFPIPFYGFLVRLVPTDSDEWQLFGAEFKFQPSPDYGHTWQTPEITHGFNGFFHLHRVLLPLISNATVTFKIFVDGVETPSGGYSIPSTSGEYAKVPFQLVPTKGKSMQYQLVSEEPFRLFAQDIEILGKAWNAGGPFQSLRVLGGPSNQSGAEI